MTIVQSSHELLEEVPSFWFRELPRICYEVEKLTTLRHLQNNIRHIFLLATIFDKWGSAYFLLLDDVIMFELAHSLDFHEHKLLHLIVHIIVHYFDCNFLPCFFVDTELDFTAAAVAKCARCPVFSNLSWHFFPS